MLGLAARLGCDSLATGHYARVRDGLLRVAVDAAKDQTYMLCALAPESIARMRFPLGELTKPQVRAIAREAGLSVASKPDSQDLCFLAGTGRERFLARHGGVREQPGEIVTADGSVVGRHRGQHLFTVGQRRGLGLDGGGTPLYVLEKDARTGRVLVGPREALGTRTVALRGVRLHRDGARVDRVKLRYRSAPVPAALEGEADAGRHRRVTVSLAEPVDGVAPGQVACLMEGEAIVGYGTITDSRRAS
jgi:tRNA-specific 2-thiouridylase